MNIKKLKEKKYSEIDIFFISIFAFLVGIILYGAMKETPCRDYCIYSELKINPEAEFKSTEYDLDDFKNDYIKINKTNAEVKENV